MKTPLTELIERLELWQHNTKNQYINCAFRECQILATELLEKERAEILNAYFEGKMDSVRENRGHMIAELYFKERYNQNKLR